MSATGVGLSEETAYIEAEVAAAHRATCSVYVAVYLDL
jgi:hypothetical protein